MIHRKLTSRSLIAAYILSALVTADQPARAQSGTRNANPAAPPAAGGSQSRTTKAAVALDGYCPVCVVEMKQWIRGKVEHQVTYDGRTYLFPSDEQKQMFLSAPEKYTPAFGGDCTVCSVCRVEMNQEIQGKPEIAAFYQGLRYLFPGPEQRRMFLSNPQKYAVPAAAAAK